MGASTKNQLIGAGTGLALGGPIGALAGWGITKAIGGPDPTSFTGGGGTYTPGSLAPEGVGGKQDSLTQATRALSNYTGQKGQDLLESGEDLTGEGLQGERSGEAQLNPVIDYFRKLMSGDRAELASAMQPETDQIAQQFGQIRQMFSQTGARGGGTTSTLAASPFEQARQTAELASRARMGGAGKVGELASEKARLGLAKSGVGLTQEGVGSGLEGLTQQALMARRGQNISSSNADKQMIAQGMSNLLTTLV